MRSPIKFDKFINLSVSASLAFYLRSIRESREIRQYIWTAALLEAPRSFLCPQPQQLVRSLIAGKHRLSILWETLFAFAVETFNRIELKIYLFSLVKVISWTAKRLRTIVPFSAIFFRTLLKWRRLYRNSRKIVILYLDQNIDFYLIIVVRSKVSACFYTVDDSTTLQLFGISTSNLPGASDEIPSTSCYAWFQMWQIKKSVETRTKKLF